MMNVISFLFYSIVIALLAIILITLIAIVIGVIKARFHKSKR